MNKNTELTREMLPYLVPGRRGINIEIGEIAWMLYWRSENPDASDYVPVEIIKQSCYYTDYEYHTEISDLDVVMLLPVGDRTVQIKEDPHDFKVFFYRPPGSIPIPALPERPTYSRTTLLPEMRKDLVKITNGRNLVKGETCWVKLEGKFRDFIALEAHNHHKIIRVGIAEAGHKDTFPIGSYKNLSMEDVLFYRPRPAVKPINK